MKHIKLFEEFVSESNLINEYTSKGFEPEVISKKDAIDAKVLKGLMSKTAKTSSDAIKRLGEFSGDIMNVHVQYHEVKPNGNAPDRISYRIHQQQFWLNSSQLSRLNKNGQDVNVTLLSITDMTNGVSLGRVYVDTKVFLDELGAAFEILRSQS
jgi:hypothetical protein